MASGNIEKRGDGRYRLTISAGYDVNGKRVKYRKTISAKSDRDAQKQLALFIAEVEKGEFVASVKLTFKEFSDRWIENYAESNLSAKTLSRYKDMLRNTVLPAIGIIRLEELKPLHLLQLYSTLGKDGARKDGKTGGYSTKTIRHVHILIHGILEKAVEWQVLQSNPASKVKPPKVQTKEVEAYDAEQVAALFQSLKTADIKYRTIITLAVLTGLRRGEIVALEWSDINLEAKEISIRKAAVYTPETGVIIKDTKTTRSQRVIFMPETAKKSLQAYKLWQDKIIIEAGNLYQNENRVFTQAFGAVMHPDTISGWFSKFIKENNLPHISFHGLRHSCATLLLNSGVDLETVSRILGHANSMITSAIYLHSSERAKIDAADKIERFLGEAEVPR